MRRLLETAERVAASEATILITGESGTGKNVLARQIHRWSPRSARDRSSLSIAPHCPSSCSRANCSAMSRAHSPARLRTSPGRLEAANGGTVFLDEIADLSPPLQAKFLRFVQEQSFRAGRGGETIHIDARIIAASNRDLPAEVAAHRFREDLFYRLNVIALHMPPLRERPEDILPLAERLLSAAAVRNHRGRLRFSAEAAAALTPTAGPAMCANCATPSSAPPFFPTAK